MEAGILVYGIGATTAALHCPDLRIAHDVIDDHHRRLANSRVNVEREPYRSIWMDAAVESEAAARQDPWAFCASLRRDYGPTGAIFPGLVRDR